MKYLIALSALLGLTTALPLEFKTNLFSRAAGDQAATMLQAIAPTSNTCTGAPFPAECETASTAAPFLIAAMVKYEIYNPAELSALISLIAFETGDFKYAINHYPGRAGQGTRNMQMASYNLEYALSIPELKSAAQAIAPASSTSGLSDDKLNAIRALVLPDTYAWGSAAWFLTTQCPASVRTQLQNGGQAGWENYLVSCVGTPATDDRKAYWTRSNAAFGIA